MPRRWGEKRTLHGTRRKLQERLREQLPSYIQDLKFLIWRCFICKNLNGFRKHLIISFCKAFFTSISDWILLAGTRRRELWCRLSLHMKTQNMIVEMTSVSLHLRREPLQSFFYMSSAIFLSYRLHPDIRQVRLRPCPYVAAASVRLEVFALVPI